MLAFALMLGAGTCDDCLWTVNPPPPVGPAALGVVPAVVDVFVADPSRPETVQIAGYVWDQWHRVMKGYPVQFELAASGEPVTIAPTSGAVDTITATIGPRTATTDFDVSLTAKVLGTGLSIPAKIRVRYRRVEPHGASLGRASPSPAVGLGVGQTGGGPVVQVQAFHWKVDFGKFVAAGAGVVPSGTVLSPVTAAWRASDPWVTTPAEVIVPTDAAPIQVPVRMIFAGPAPAQPALDQFLFDTQAAADIVERLPIGVQLAVPLATESAGAVIPWADCSGVSAPLAALPVALQPALGAITFYMLERTGLPAGDRALHCGPGTLTAPLHDRTVVLVPQGPVTPATLAHELGHAFGLSHVTGGSGYFDDNLMVETDNLSAGLRHRLTVGQLFRAGLDPRSWIVRRGLALGATVDCTVSAVACPTLESDVLRRVP